jgi:chemotaxis protein MotB
MNAIAQPAPARAQRVSTAVGRYRRWHVDTRSEPEEEGWLLTYLDVITLILVLMVVMLAFAGPGKGKDGAQTEANATTEQPPGAGPVPGALNPGGSIAPPAVTPTTPSAPSAEPAQPTPKTLNGFPLDQLGADIEVLMNDDAVRFRISSEILFESGAAQFAAAGQPVLDKLIPLLNADPSLRLVVEGHTDNQPIQTERFPSNWELSTGRAAAVARYLIEHGIAPQRVQASGFADTRPLGSRDNPVDRVHNRRVELTMERAPSPPKPAR